MRLNISLSAASSILFHYTGLSSLVSIFKTNEFRLSTKLGAAGEDRGDSQLYYMSLTRSRLGSYHAKASSYGSVLIRLDGNKLSHKYKVKPIDYWGPTLNDPSRDEMEDRLVTNEPVIKNAISYFLSIDVLIDKDMFEHRLLKNEFKHQLRICLLASKKYNIPLHFYYSRKDWLLANTKNCASINIRNLFTAKPLKDNTFLDADRSNKAKYLKPKKSLINDLLESYRVINLEISPREKYFKLSLNGQSMVDGMKNDYRRNELYKDILCEVRDLRGTNSNSVKRLTTILAANKMTFESFYYELASKWKKCNF